MSIIETFMLCDTYVVNFLWLTAFGNEHIISVSVNARDEVSAVMLATKYLMSHYSLAVCDNVRLVDSVIRFDNSEDTCASSNE